MNYNRLREAFKNSGLSKLQLAAITGISDVTIGKILNGADSKITTLEAVANALGKSVGYFFDEPNQTINTASGKQTIAGEHNNISGNINLTPPPAGSQTIVSPDGTTATIKTGEATAPGPDTSGINDDILKRQQKLISLNDQIIEAQNILKNLNTNLKNQEGGSTP